MKIKNHSKVMTKAVCCICIIFLGSCSNAVPDPGKTKEQIDTTNYKHNPTAIATAYQLGGDSGWAYTVDVDNKPYIDQKRIPAIQGIKTFATKEDAQKTGDWVAAQIKEGKKFSVTDSLLKKLGVKW